MKMSVHLDLASKVPSSFTSDSSVRQEVVPTQMTRPPFCFVSFSMFAVSAFIMHSSECI